MDHMDRMDMGPSQRDMPSGGSHMDMALWSGGWSPESPLTLPIIGWTSTSFGSFLFLLLAVFVFGLLSEAASELVAADEERLRRIKENHRHRLLGGGRGGGYRGCER